MAFLNKDGPISTSARDNGQGKPITDVEIVRVKNSPILQNAATVAGNGTIFYPASSNATLTFEITGTSTSRTIVFEMAGISGVYRPVTAFNVLDPSIMATQTTGGTDAAPESWQVDVPYGWTFRARISAVSGGNVSVKGKAVE